ncbi:MAG: hypothetical protein U0586_17325 [Candidatus Brocadiaceae bacterium]
MPNLQGKGKPGEKFCKKDGTPLVHITSPAGETITGKSASATPEERAKRQWLILWKETGFVKKEKSLSWH